MRSGETAVTSGPGVPPLGIRICVNGQATQFEGFGQEQDISRMPYPQACQQVGRALAYLALRSAVDDARIPASSGPYRDSMGNEVTPRPGYAHYSIDGWAGKAEGWVKLPEAGDAFKEYWSSNQWAGRGEPEAFLKPLAEKMAPELEAVGQGLFKDANQRQMGALQVYGVDITKGSVSPPPGYTVEFLGRRKDSQSGPTFAFTPVDETQVAKRLSLAIRNALYRDSQPPSGRWTEADRIASKAPEPKLARVKITGPGSTKYAFDLPTSGRGLDTTLAEQTAIASGAAKTANAKALTHPSDGTQP